MQLQVKDLKCIRNNRTLFANINFTINAGEILHIIGANGAGKSSLLQILCGLMQSQEGNLYWQGQLINHETCVDYRANLAYVGHKIGVKDGLTVQENLNMISKLAYSYAKINWANVLTRLELTQLRYTFCQKLSAGQRQRVALARLLIIDAPLGIVDEPFTAMDKTGIAYMQQLISEHTLKGGMVILTTHQSIDLPNVALKELHLAS